MEATRVYIANLRATGLTLLGLVLLLRFMDAVATVTLIFALILVLAMVLHPLATALERCRVPRVVAAIVVTTLLLGVFGGAVVLMLPVAVRQMFDFVQLVEREWPEWKRSALAWLHRYPDLERWVLDNVDAFTREITPHLGRLFMQFGRYTVGAAGMVLASGIVYVMLIFVLAQPEPLVRGLLGAVPESQRQSTKIALQRSMKAVQAWAAATLFNMIAIGLMTWVGLKLVGIPHAELFAILAGVLEALPTIGPILSAIPPLLVALAESPMQALLVLILFVFIQQSEANLLAPVVLSRQTQLHPLTVVFSLLAFGAVWGVLGAILAIPIVSVVKVLYQEFYYKKKITDERSLAQDVWEVLGTVQAERERWSESPPPAPAPPSTPVPPPAPAPEAVADVPSATEER